MRQRILPFLQTIALSLLSCSVCLAAHVCSSTSVNSFISQVSHDCNENRTARTDCFCTLPHRRALADGRPALNGHRCHQPRGLGDKLPLATTATNDTALKTTTVRVSSSSARHSLPRFAKKRRKKRRLGSGPLPHSVVPCRLLRMGQPQDYWHPTGEGVPSAAPRGRRGLSSMAVDI